MISALFQSVSVSGAARHSDTKHVPVSIPTSLSFIVVAHPHHLLPVCFAIPTSTAGPPALLVVPRALLPVCTHVRHICISNQQCHHRQGGGEVRYVRLLDIDASKAELWVCVPTVMMFSVCQLVCMRCSTSNVSDSMVTHPPTVRVLNVKACIVRSASRLASITTHPSALLPTSPHVVHSFFTNCVV